jgi:DNA-directed RNA polymerase specialized sigma24 family protein
MRVWDGLSYKEIAEITGKSEASTKMAFGRILEKMQKEIPFAMLLLMLFKP